jgi:hypothetical protein
LTPRDGGTICGQCFGQVCQGFGALWSEQRIELTTPLDQSNKTKSNQTNPDQASPLLLTTSLLTTTANHQPQT